MTDTAPAGRRREDFLEYFEAIDRHPLVGGAFVWLRTAVGVYQSFPFHVVADGPGAGRGAFRHPQVMAVRFPVRADEATATGALWTRLTPYQLDELSSNTRSKVRRGLKRTQVRRVRFADIREDGVRLAVSTATRQGGTFTDAQAALWRRTCDVADRTEGVEAWAGYVDDELAVLATCYHVEDCFQISALRSDDRLLSAYPNNAMMHTLLEDGFSRPGTTSVCYGLASLDKATTGLNEFKLAAGFEALPVRDTVLARLPVVAAARAARPLIGRLPASHRSGQLQTLVGQLAWRGRG